MSIPDIIVENIWIPITIAAAAMQTARTTLQKNLATNLSTNASTLARYLYGLPIAMIYLVVVRAFDAAPQPDFNMTFALNILMGGVAQIIATSLLIMALTARSYAVGTALSKTEAMQAALLAVVFLGEHLSWGGIVALLISGVGVMTMSAPGKTWSFTIDRAAVYGLLSGTMFGFTAVGIRGANLALHTSFVTAAATTLAVMIVFQTIILGAYLIWFETPQFRALLKAWRPSLGVGVFSALGSIGWFTGMALEKAAYVRTLGQVELVFTVLVARFYFRETLRPRELTGMVLIVAGIVILVLVA
ncbi:MAG: DMT family transporter [Rhodospirillaceae bacterium]|nr:DMT family transporter [Rhodospirillaceae bacterium]